MDQERELRRYDRLRDPTRVLNQSDRVFTIVLTLLVLEVQVPDLGGGQSLGEALDEVRPSFIQAVVIGYVVLGLATRGLEEAGLYPRCECDPDCWCKRPGLTEFRWVFPRGHKGPWNRTAT